MGASDYLVISDLQIPFEHEKALAFCVYIKRHYKIPDENVLNVGDELDAFWGGLWDKSPDVAHTANQEIQAANDILKTWYDAFPLMKLCDSNHGTRWKRKALAAQIPSQMMRLYREVIEAPEGWQWRKHWSISTKNRFIVEHGDDWGGAYPHTMAAMHNGCSTVMGHHHSKAAITHMQTNHQRIWGMVTGSLIDFDAYAFEYARNAKLKPLIGVGMVCGNGATPLWLPLT